MYRLQPGAFNAWFQALNSTPPFPWQVRLFRDWLCPADPEKARWPSTVSLPTASGKTSLIELAVLALACGSPCARRRITFVVDRRLVVDEAARRAQRLAKVLRSAYGDPDHPLHAAASRLVEIGGEADEPLLVARLRGGIEFDDSWTRNPAQPAVILSTVDQVGSRLLFRAYGPLSPRSWSIPAGLLGIDTLILIDEAHCANPFCETLYAIETHWQKWAETPIQPGLVHVRISATLNTGGEFALEPEDLSCPTLAERLTTPKWVNLQEVPSQNAAAREPLESEIVAKAKDWFESHDSGVLAVVVNRVRSARHIYKSLPLPDHQKLLLTGRARPWERDRLLKDWLPRLQAGRRATDTQYAVVATQCIEVGADFDFDYLISEAASLDALRQRFGRLDRLGARKLRLEPAPPEEPAGVVLALAPQVALDAAGEVKTPDPIYDRALARTWQLLQERQGDNGRVDFSHSSLSRWLATISDFTDFLQPSRSAFPLLPAYLDLLAQTSPHAEPDVEIAAFLHGTVTPSADVLIVWRADLDTSDPDSWADRVAVQPPLAGEACAVPVWEARAWLAAQKADFEISHDLESSGDSSGGETDDSPSGGRLALAWRGADDSVLRLPGEIRPGDLLVVPGSYGGCTKFGWDPNSEEEVSDIGDAIAVVSGRRPVLRIGVLRQLARLHDCRAAAPEEPPTAGSAPSEQVTSEPPVTLVSAASRIAEAAADPDLDPHDRDDAVDEALQQLRQMAEGLQLDWLGRLSELLLKDRERELEYDDEGNLIAIVGAKVARGEAETGSDTAQFRRTRPVSLDKHQAGVEDEVLRIADALQLASPLRSALARAAKFHDLGKCDPRFQAWLRGSPVYSPVAEPELLAKSCAVSSRNAAAIRRARLLAGYPAHTRHEALSAWLAEQSLTNLPAELDLELVVHLIASHHGYARPWFPVPEPSPAIPIAVEIAGRRFERTIDIARIQNDPQVVDRFWRLIRRYGWWGLAFLEAVFRLADHRRSNQEEVDAAVN